MQAILNEDIIVGQVMDGGTEIGKLPKGVGFERLRFDGDKVVDLSGLSTFYVRVLGSGAFELHAVPVADSRPVTMTYADRHILIQGVGGPRLKTTQEITDEAYAAGVAAAKSKLKARLKSKVGTIEDQMMNTLAFVSALIVYSRTQNAALGQFFDDIIPVIKDIYPLARFEQILKAGGGELRSAMLAYYDDLDQI